LAPALVAKGRLGHFRAGLQQRYFRAATVAVAVAVAVAFEVAFDVAFDVDPR
jgi:hypothetical protein